MTLAVPTIWKCQRGAKCMVRCPGCPGPKRRTIVLSPLTPEQEAYLRQIEGASSNYDPDKIIGGPQPKS